LIREFCAADGLRGARRAAAKQVRAVSAARGGPYGGSSPGVWARYGGRRASPGDLTYGAHGDTSGPYGRTVGFCGRAAGFRGPAALADALSALQARCRLPRTHCRLLRTHCRLFGRAVGSCGGAGGRAASPCGAVPDSVLEPGGARSPPRHLGRSVRRPADQPVHRRVGTWPSARRGTGRAPDRPPNVPDLPVHPPAALPPYGPPQRADGSADGRPGSAATRLRGGCPRRGSAADRGPVPDRSHGGRHHHCRSRPVRPMVPRHPVRPHGPRPPRGAERGHQDEAARAVAGPGRRLVSDRLRSRHASRDSSQAPAGAGLRRRTWSRPGAAGAPPW
jgi:hypothetical protein